MILYYVFMYLYIYIFDFTLFYSQSTICQLSYLTISNINLLQIKEYFKVSILLKNIVIKISSIYTSIRIRINSRYKLHC